MIVSGSTIEIPSMNLLQMLERTVNRYPGQVATWFMGESLSYGNLYQRTLRTMAQLTDLGVKPGHRVGIMLPNCPQYVIAYFAVTGLGAIVVQVNPMSTVSELTYLLTDSGAQVMVAHESMLRTVERARSETPLRSVVGVRFLSDSQNLFQEIQPEYWLEDWFDGDKVPAEVAPIDPEEVAVLQYTGGTTGRPKGAMLTHRNLVANAFQSNTMIPGGVTLEDKMVCALPFFHVYAMTVCMNLSVLSGMAMLILPRFEPRALVTLFKEHRPTLFPAVPTMYVALGQVVKEGSDLLSSLRVCNSGGAPLPEQVMVHFERLTGAVVLEGYGLSEASPVTHTNPSADSRKPGSIGLPLANTEARIVDPGDGDVELGVNEIGELLIRGPQVMKGYWQRPEETRRTLVNGWLHTGDIAKIDEDGYAYIVDRKKDLIIASGFNVYPREVEEVLFQHADVLEAAVVGVPDEYRGETVAAYVVLKPGSLATEEDIMEWCREHLSAYKTPRSIELRDSLPKSAVGKVLRRDLRK